MPPPAREPEEEEQEGESERLLAAPTTSAPTDDASQLADESASLSLTKEAMSLFRLALPMSLGQVIGMLGWQVNLILIGHIGAKELGASAMARMWMGMSACEYSRSFRVRLSLASERSCRAQTPFSSAA